ncbi:hypothetical protein HMPREF3127_23415 [Sphingobacterium sp. HMSC13C05]|nr:hypothetical protein HMPREF3127_23415 [Sphingobacterium sp. HMSC13C05]
MLMVPMILFANVFISNVFKFIIFAYPYYPPGSAVEVFPNDRTGISLSSDLLSYTKVSAVIFERCLNFR